MKRPIALILAGLLFAPSTYAFRTTTVSSPKSVAVVSEAVSLEGDERMVRNAVARELVRELRRRGYDAFEAESAGRGEADYVVEIVGGEPASTGYGDVNLDGRNGGVSLGLVIARVAAEVRVYEGNDLELLSSERLSKRSSRLLPTGVGVGGGVVFAFIALPFIERAQLRGVARDAARDAVSGVVATMNSR
jgi:hypothetical protein